MTTAIVPFRCPWHGKSRLRRHLPAPLCDALSFSMYADVVEALRASDVKGIVTLVHGSCGAQAADDVGSQWVIHPNDRGLNDALAWALSGFGRPVLIAAADLPALHHKAVNEMLADPADVVIAPTQDGGTGLLRVGCRRPLELAYGEGSAEKHALAATSVGLTVAMRPRHYEHEDVDTVDDLLVTVARHEHVGPATREVFSTLVRSARRPTSPNRRIISCCP